MISFVLIGERSNRHDITCFVLCTLGVILLTDPFKDTPLHQLDLQNLAGTSLAFLSSLSFNISYIALRKLSKRPVSSWVLVFHIMTTNLLLTPSCFLTYDVAYKHRFCQYTDRVWTLLLLIGTLTLSTLYFTHLTFFYESAARGSAYTNFELIYTFCFDVLVMKNSFRVEEMAGAALIVVANLYIYVLKSLGVIN